MQSVVVTGANGFVGQALARRLADEGVCVYAVVHAKGSDVLEAHPSIRVIECSYQDYSDLASRISPQESLDAFYHFAWAGTSGIARADVSLQLTNVQAACEAVNQACRLGADRFVFAGSIMEEEVLQIVYRQKAFPGASHIYSAAKLAADSMCCILAANGGLAYMKAVISNVYGPGEWSERFVVTALKKMLMDEPIPLSTCEQLYDFIYIDDAVEGLRRIGDSGVAGSSYYLGSRSQVPLADYVIQMRDVVNSKSELLFGELGSVVGLSEVYAYLDSECVYDSFGFDSTVSFPDGIRRTAGWLAGMMKRPDAER